MLRKVGDEDTDDDQAVRVMSVAGGLAKGSGYIGEHGTRIERAGRRQVRPGHDIGGYLGPWCMVFVGVEIIQSDDGS